MMNKTIKQTLLVSILLVTTAFMLIMATASCNPVQDQEDAIRRFTLAFPPGTEINTTNTNEISIQLFESKEKTFVIVDAPSNYNYAKMINLLGKEAATAIQNVKPLQRIYKMDQQKEYTPEEGQLLAVHKNTKRYVMTLEIVNDQKLREEYIAVHGIGKAWPQITKNMKQMGIRDMELYLDGYRAYLIMDTRKDFDMAKDGEKWSTLPREAEWQEHVAKFQKVDPLSKATEKWVTMTLQN